MIGEHGRIRTHSLSVRGRMRYPISLRAHDWRAYGDLHPNYSGLEVPCHISLGDKPTVGETGIEPVIAAVSEQCIPVMLLAYLKVLSGHQRSRTSFN